MCLSLRACGCRKRKESQCKTVTYAVVWMDLAEKISNLVCSLVLCFGLFLVAVLLAFLCFSNLEPMQSLRFTEVSCHSADCDRDVARSYGAKKLLKRFRMNLRCLWHSKGLQNEMKELLGAQNQWREFHHFWKLEPTSKVFLENSFPYFLLWNVFTNQMLQKFAASRIPLLICRSPYLKKSKFTGQFMSITFLLSGPWVLKTFLDAFNEWMTECIVFGLNDWMTEWMNEWLSE